jgi:cytochrome oxidase assembly protein ShyY1
MTRLKQVLVIVLGTGLAGAMVALGFWQLGVSKAQGAEAAERRASAPPVPLSSVARAGTTGRYDGR